MNSSGIKSILHPLRIGEHIARYPIIQGAMSVGVSGAKLASAVANAGGVGVIASMGIGLNSPYFHKRQKGSFFTANQLALKDELRKARIISPEGIIGVNVLVATRDYLTLAQTAATAGANLIITGAGLPLTLPEFTVDYPDVALVPSVANVQSAKLICETWKTQYNCLPDALILENCQKVGGHFSQCEQANFPGFSIKWVISELQEYLGQQEKSIALIITGGIGDRTEIDRILGMGADGVQIGTRFITTEECDADLRYKEFHLRATPEDIVTVPSPVGKPSRALKNAFAEKAISSISCANADLSLLERRCIANCLESCLCRDSKKTYCLLQALSKAACGDIENGLIFSGANLGSGDRIISVSELMAELTC
ncbi:NAD(P)H-dependent flavin oxidoreductase [Sphaerospermopsis torques-reginae]|uniref:Nitronate monooxygenase family protein n=1 Tax=Sphaerospermopsis torques-reginae ITEP-024 TaxID=984208 RepID=A0ABX8X046_9CYAN|nr:nitronate monooxygenase family protein [Sphaerospermopsis torques-reginae]QYX32078.1 nitronate monooxygenase family protein [Sphaerospermopsis torques-reginae ITEP-024]